MPRIIRFHDLEATWTTKQARQPGTMRWLVTWVGGPAGHINTNPDIAVESRHGAVGMMVLPRGQRQAGKHVHKVTETYVVLQGELEGFDASGHPHHAGPMDCIDIPPGCPHGVRNCGLDDVVLIWVHDGIERDDAAIYYPDDHLSDTAPPIALIPFAGLTPDWSAPGAREGGTMRWSVTWIDNAKVAIGLTVLEPGHAVPAAAQPLDRLALVIGGTAVTRLDGRAVQLGHLDGLHLPAGESAVLRNQGFEPLRLLWVDSQPNHAA